MTPIKYRSEIDGLRAIAVIPVILFHLNNELLPGGFIGVDVFFVISGFLITSIILNEYKHDTFSFAEFWLRRIRRILPALITMVLTTLVVGTIILYAPDISNLGNQGIASLLSFANITHWLIAGDYWRHAAESSPFLHTWSLSVEEQFYLLFPVLLIATLKNFHKWLFLTFLTLSVLSTLLFLYGTKAHPVATFYLIPTRAWELGVGVLLAILFFKKKMQFTNSPSLSIIGISAVLLSYFFISGEDGISPFLIIPVLGTALIIAFAKDNENIVNRGLSSLPVVYIGKISYSLYLWHWPVLVLSKQLSLKQNVSFNSIFVLAVIFILSILSYHFIEVPTRRNKKIVPYILSALLVGVVFSYVLKISDYSEDISLFNETEWTGRPYNVAPSRKTPGSGPGNNRMKGITISGNRNTDINTYSNGGIRRTYGAKTPEIVVLGDSHAMMWAKILDETAEKFEKSISFYVANGIPAFFSVPPIKKPNGTLYFSADEKLIYDKARLKYLDEWKPKIVVISNIWSNVNLQDTRDLIEYIGSIGSKVLLIEQPPELFFGDKNAPQYFSYLGLTPENNSKQYIRHISSSNYERGLSLVKQLSKECNHCQRIATADIFLDNEKVWVIDSFNALYIDDDHLSRAGALKVKNRIVSAVKNNL